MDKKKIVVIGNGMAGARVVEEILGRVPGRFDFVMFGAEPYGNYNRILLSNVLNQTQEANHTFINPFNSSKSLMVFTSFINKSPLSIP